MSEPLLVKATEWNDTKLKQQEAAENKCLIKAVPDTFPDLLQKADLASADNMETVEYSGCCKFGQQDQQPVCDEVHAQDHCWDRQSRAK